jgi:uncharacterized membrane protein YdjX (TVP38/TMEM64 family)
MRLPERYRRIAALAGFPAMIFAVLVSAFFFRKDLYELFRSSESVRAWVAARGVLAPLAFIGLQIVQVIVFVIPGEVVQIAGGFAFGLWAGTLWSVTGILAGSLINFSIGRILGRPFVDAVFGAERARRVEAATGGGKAASGFFLLFVIPGIPKDALTYIAGASRLSFGAFIAASTLGRLPGIFGSSYMGSAAFEKDYSAAIVVLVAASLMFAAGLLFRDRLHALVARFISRKKDGER